MSVGVEVQRDFLITEVACADALTDAALRESVRHGRRDIVPRRR